MRTALLTVLALACSPPHEPVDSGGPPDSGDSSDSGDDTVIPGTGADCGDTDPEIDALRIEDGGMFEFEQDVWYPSILLHADATDEDGDLTYYTMRVWFDTTVNGSVSTDGAYAEVFGTNGTEDCSVPSHTATMRLAITGTGQSPAFDTRTEFAAVVMDDRDHASSPAIAVFTTPGEDGSY